MATGGELISKELTEKQKAHQAAGGQKIEKEKAMKVLRKIKMKTDRLEIGDQIKVKFFNEKHYATAIRRDEDNVFPLG